MLRINLVFNLKYIYSAVNISYFLVFKGNTAALGRMNHPSCGERARLGLTSDSRFK
jgi:hypothetical protein